MSKYNIDLNIDVPHDNKEEVEVFITEINNRLNKYLGQPCSEHVAREIQFELEQLYSEHPEYNNILINCKDFGSTEYWSIDKLLKEYSETYPDRYESKNEYTRMEINNMLFELELANVILAYRSPAVCADLPSYNTQIYADDVEVEVPIINVGDKKEYNDRRGNIKPKIIHD